MSNDNISESINGNEGRLHYGKDLHVNDCLLEAEKSYMIACQEQEDSLNANDSKIYKDQLSI